MKNLQDWFLLVNTFMTLLIKTKRSRRVSTILLLINNYLKQSNDSLNISILRKICSVCPDLLSLAYVVDDKTLIKLKSPNKLNEEAKLDDLKYSVDSVEYHLELNFNKFCTFFIFL